MPASRPEPIWKHVLTLVALAAALIALYLQVFERRARQEEARLAAVRLTDALAESRTRLRGEILAALRAELAAEDSPGEGSGDAGPEPRPDTVLRRLEAGGTLEQALGAAPAREALLARFDQALEALSREMQEADRVLRRDLEELRAAARREAEVAAQTLALLLVALLCLIGRALPDLWPRRP